MQDEQMMRELESAVRKRLWLSGAVENLLHGISHYRSGADDHYADLRFALIHTDNAVEIAMKMYFKHERSQKTKSNEFRSLLDELASQLPLDCHEQQNILHCRNLRNDLYHEGNGMVVEPKTVCAYLTMAASLFERMYGLTIPFAERMSPSEADTAITRLQTLSSEVSQEYERARQSRLFMKHVRKEFDDAVMTRYRVAGYDVERLAELKLNERENVICPLLCRSQGEIVVGMIFVEGLMIQEEHHLFGLDGKVRILTPNRSRFEEALDSGPEQKRRFVVHILNYEKECPAFVSKIREIGWRVEDWDVTRRILGEMGEQARAEKWDAVFAGYLGSQKYHSSKLNWIHGLHVFLEQYDAEELQDLL